ncbi:MAG: hypothetical protein ACLFSV_11845 [Alkalispirochaeta sp.]
MAKISNEARQQYFERIKEYKQLSESILQREKSLLKIVKSPTTGAAYKYITLAEERLNLASYFLLQNALSMSLLGVKNDAYLNDARKSCYQAVIYLEEVVSNYIDVPFSDYSDLLEEIDGYEDEKRYHLIRKIGFTIQSVEDAFGPNSKWRWSFVELEGRFAAVAKNMINFKTFIGQMDPSIDGYASRMGLLELVETLLGQSADRYREKYELSTLRIDDFKRAIAFLAALKRIYTILGEVEKAEDIKRKMDVWKSKMDSDEKIQAKKKKTLQR